MSAVAGVTVSPDFAGHVLFLGVCLVGFHKSEVCPGFLPMV